jgi:hypothetical protein
MERGKQKTISLKVAASVDRMLTRRAAESGAGKSDLVREALARYLLDDAKPTAGSFLEAALDLEGCVEGPADLASDPRHLAGYGARWRR